MKKYKLLVISIVLFSNLFILFVNNGVCEDLDNNILYVGRSGQAEFLTVNDAINKSQNGDSIIVYAGIYYENILINKSINLIGENKETTKIISKNGTNTITIKSDYINITDFTIKGGINSGIFIESSSSCNIFKNIISNNSIGIFINSTKNLQIYNNTISNNSEFGIFINN